MDDEFAGGAREELHGGWYRNASVNDKGSAPTKIPSDVSMSDGREGTAAGRSFPWFRLVATVTASAQGYLASEGTPEMEAALQEAEEESVVTCEVCGAAGRLAQRERWWSTRCAVHETWRPGQTSI
jgi:hypothetical protein